MALANITNNILTDSGILVTNLTPTSRTITINGTTYDLSADRSWTIATGVGGSGTTNYLPKFTGTSTIGNSAVFESSGNVGINTALPSGIVNGKGLVIYDTLYPRLILQNSTTGTGTGAYSGMWMLGNDLYVQNSSTTGSVKFAVNSSSDAMTLNASGNLGLGVTPSTWTGTGAKALQFQNGSLAASTTYGTILSWNAYYDGGYKYFANSSSGVFNIAGDAFIWYQAAAGTAGNAISFTQAMTLNASGNLSIGNTNDSFKLDVTGTGRFTSGVIVGDGTTNKYVIVNGANSGSVGGSAISFQNGGTGVGAIGNQSAVIGGAYNSDLMIYSANATKFFNGSATALTIASTGAATFSSSVTATGGTASYSTSALPTATISTTTTGAINAAYTSIRIGARGQSGQDQSIAITNVPTADGNSAIAFTTMDSYSYAERMRITSGGTLLVGTTTEAFAGGKLQVEGTIRAAGQFTSVLPSSNFGYFDGSGQVVASASSASSLYLDATWNTTGNPDAIFLNITNTASGASAKLLNLKVGSVSQFNVSKAGAITTGALTNGTAQPWKLGNAVSGSLSTNHYIIVEINGTTYSIPALQGLP